ncbi:alkaline phosphatase family protein [Mucilaginibacter sp. P25]|uniref:alkaline phosphatase family protein n=1 Tax=unclassified Mucilaginibacter TaxID=2617802 RepID=UPI003D66BDE2
MFFERIKEERPNAKIVSFSSSAIFKNKLTQGAAVSELYSTDEQIKTAVVNDLNTDTAQLIVGHFNDIKEAGVKYGFDNSSSQYKASIEKFDGYVGEIINALKKGKIMPMKIGW